MLLSIIMVGVIPNLYGMEGRPNNYYMQVPITLKARKFFGTSATAFIYQKSQGFQESQGWFGWAYHGACGVLDSPVVHTLLPIVFYFINEGLGYLLSNKRECEKLAAEETRERIELMRANRKRVENINESLRVALRNAHREEISDMDKLIKNAKTKDEKEKFLQQRKKIIECHNQVINTPPEIVQVEVNRRHLYD